MRADHYRLLSHAHFFTIQTSFLIPLDYVPKCCIQRSVISTGIPPLCWLREAIWCNVTLRGVRAALLWWSSDKCYMLWVSECVSVCVCVCVCSCSYPPCNAHVPYCHLWPVRLYSIFPRLINGTIFERNKLLNVNREFRFFLQLFLKLYIYIYIYIVIRRNGWDMIKNVCRSSCYILVILIRF